MQVLLSHGAAVEQKDGYKQTALHLAAASKKPLVVALLVAHKADVLCRDVQGACTALVPRCTTEQP